MKLTVVGGGNAGSISIAHFLASNLFTEIEWIYDSTRPPVPVGESTLLSYPLIMGEAGIRNEHLLASGGRPKLGIYKENWANQATGAGFFESFSTGAAAWHISANTLQDYLLEFFSNKITITDRQINSLEDIDSDWIIDCRGFPKDYSNHELSEFINVNATYVTQCPWEHCLYDYTLTIARPYGWVFGIPLRDRLSVGYMYNSDINTLEEIKEDVKNVFERFKATPSDKTWNLNFKSYWKKENIVNNVISSGNSSFFLEPLEATSLSFIGTLNEIADEHIRGNTTLEEANNEYINEIKKIETIIMLHYSHGSAFKTDFWEYAEERGRKRIELATKYDPNWRHAVAKAKSNTNLVNSGMSYGTWEYSILQYNIKNLGFNNI